MCYKPIKTFLKMGSLKRLPWNSLWLVRKILFSLKKLGLYEISTLRIYCEVGTCVMLLSNWNLDGKKTERTRSGDVLSGGLLRVWVQIMLHSELQPAGLNRESVREKGQIIRLKKMTLNCWWIYKDKMKIRIFNSSFKTKIWYSIYNLCRDKD